MVKKYNFSDNLLQMKFMKRTRDQIVQEKYDELGRATFKNLISNEMKDASCDYIIEPSCIACEGANFGRLSYNGMNPDVERIMQENAEAENLIRKIIKEENVDITTHEMAQIYSKSRLAKAVNKKFKSKREYKEEEKINNISKKPKFLKPADD